MEEKIERRWENDPSISAASASSTNHHDGPTAVGSRVTAARAGLEAAIKNGGLQKPGESMRDAVKRMQRDFVDD